MFLRLNLSASQRRCFYVWSETRGDCADIFTEISKMKTALTLAAVASLGLLAACGEKAADTTATTTTEAPADAMATTETAPAAADAMAADATAAAPGVAAAADAGAEAVTDAAAAGAVVAADAAAAGADAAAQAVTDAATKK
jgi:hypothetical protein